MTLAWLFAKGLLLGLAIAAPLGPIGALCINRTLERGFWAGLSGGLGTALADAAYAILAAAGFAAFAAFLQTISAPLSLAGGAFLIWLGLKGMGAAPAPRAAEAGRRGYLGTIATTFALTLANPMTILSFAAIFAGLGLASAPGAVPAITLVSGVFLGSLLWWAVLSGAVALAHRRLPEAFRIWVSRGSALVMLAFGGVALASGVASLL